MIDATIERAAAILRSGPVASPEIRAALLQQIATGLFGENSTIVEKIKADSRSPGSSNNLEELEESLFRIIEVSRHFPDASGPIAVVAATPPSDEVVLDRIAGSFMKHWTGKALMAVVALCLGMIGINVGVMTFQTTGLLKIKAEAQAAGEQAGLAAQKAKASADEAVLRINQRFSDTKVMEARALHDATEKIATEGITSLDRTKIEDRAVATMRAEVGASLSKITGQTDALKVQVQKLSQDVEAMEAARTEVIRARGDIKRYEAEAAAWHDAIEGQKETLKDNALVRGTWAVLNRRGWLVILAVLGSLISLGLSIVALRR